MDFLDAKEPELRVLARVNSPAWQQVQKSLYSTTASESVRESMTSSLIAADPMFSVFAFGFGKQMSVVRRQGVLSKSPSFYSQSLEANISCLTFLPIMSSRRCDPPPYEWVIICVGLINGRFLVYSVDLKVLLLLSVCFDTGPIKDINITTDRLVLLYSSSFVAIEHLNLLCALKRRHRLGATMMADTDYTAEIVYEKWRASSAWNAITSAGVSRRSLWERAVTNSSTRSQVKLELKKAVSFYDAYCCIGSEPFISCLCAESDVSKTQSLINDTVNRIRDSVTVPYQIVHYVARFSKGSWTPMVSPIDKAAIGKSNRLINFCTLRLIYSHFYNYEVFHDLRMFPNLFPAIAHSRRCHHPPSRCTASFRELCTRLSDEDTAIRFLQEKGILHQQRLCTRGHAMKLTVERNGKAPRWRRCRKAECKTEMPLRPGTGSKVRQLRTGSLIFFNAFLHHRAKAGLQDRCPVHILLEQRLLVNKVLLQGVRAEHELFSLMEEAIARGLVDERIFFDSRRNGRQLCFAPGNSYLVAASDSFGRITLWDLRRKLCIYVWKGYRDAQFGWLQVADKNMGNKKAESSLAFLLLAIFAPRLSVLQLWLVRKYRKIAVFKVDPHSHLLYSPPLWISKSNMAEQCISVCLLDSSGNILFPVVPLASCLQESGSNMCWTHELKKLYKERWQNELALQEQLDLLKGMLVSIRRVEDVESFMDEIFSDAKNLDCRLTCVLLESIVAHCDAIVNEEECLELIRRRCAHMIQVVNFYAVISALGNEKPSRLSEQAESCNLTDPFVIQTLNEKLSDILSLYDPDIEVSCLSLPEFLGLFAFDHKELVFKEGISSQQLAKAGNFVFGPFFTRVSTNRFCQYYQSLLSLSAASWVLMLCSFWLVSVRPYSVTTEQFLGLLVGLIRGQDEKEDLLDIVYKSIVSSYRIPEALCLSEFGTTIFTSLCASAATVSPSWETIDKRLILWTAMCKVLRGLYVLQRFVNTCESLNPSALSNVPKEDISLRNVLLASSDYFVEMFCKYFSIMDPPNNFLQTDGSEWWQPAFTSLKQLFPFQFSLDSLLLNLVWHTASQWHFRFANVQLLALAMQYLHCLSTARLRHCSSSLIWKTYCCDIAKSLFVCDTEFFDRLMFEQHGKSILCHLYQLITFCLDSLAQCDSDCSQLSEMPSEDFLCTFVCMNSKPKLVKKQTLLDRTCLLPLANKRNLELHRQLLLTALSACDSGNYSFGNGSALIELFPEYTRNIFFNDLSVSVSEDEQPFTVVYQPRIKHLKAINADLVERTPSGSVPNVELLTELCLAWNIDYDILRRQAIVLMLCNGDSETAFQMLNMVEDQKTMADEFFNMVCQCVRCPSLDGDFEATAPVRHSLLDEVRLNSQGRMSIKKFTLDTLKRIITYVDKATPSDWTSRAYLDRIKNDILNGLISYEIQEDTEKVL
ncbi:hypothetical protein M514_07213 [Trichuris suis]|uniref:Rab3-GAP regulatory subunit N-terminal domain-containing protein n=1 Tax=Trichuris suis TaxID=68888 RepID=A0A085NC29_9BILA|nr:hypothetical protein M514_07213 [Trichuris suis]